MKGDPGRFLGSRTVKNRDPTRLDGARFSDRTRARRRDRTLDSGFTDPIRKRHRVVTSTTVVRSAHGDTLAAILLARPLFNTTRTGCRRPVRDLLAVPFFARSLEDSARERGAPKMNARTSLIPSSTDGGYGAAPSAGHLQEGIRLGQVAASSPRPRASAAWSASSPSAPTASHPSPPRVRASPSTRFSPRRCVRARREKTSPRCVVHTSGYRSRRVARVDRARDASTPHARAIDARGFVSSIFARVAPSRRRARPPPRARVPGATTSLHPRDPSRRPREKQTNTPLLPFFPTLRILSRAGQALRRPSGVPRPGHQDDADHAGPPRAQRAQRARAPRLVRVPEVRGARFPPLRGVHHDG